MPATGPALSPSLPGAVVIIGGVLSVVASVELSIAVALFVAEVVLFVAQVVPFVAKVVGLGGASGSSPLRLKIIVRFGYEGAATNKIVRRPYMLSRNYARRTRLVLRLLWGP